MKTDKTGAYMILALGVIKFAVDTAFVIGILALLILFGLEFPHTARLDSLWPVEKLHQGMDPALALIAEKFGWSWPAQEISLMPLGAGLVLLVAKVIWDAVMSRLTRLVKKWFPLPEESLELSAAASSQGISVSSTLLALASVNPKAMEKIQRRFARVGRKLEMTKHRRCAFLSIGVVDYIDMKRGADPDKVTRSFGAYEAMLDEDFRLTSAWKKAWTPENVMVCYLEVRQALDAAQRVLRGLREFNASLNELPQPFRVCCGINEGEVAIFEDSKLQKVSDRVIDVAGHMQKNARPDSLWLSSEVYHRLEEKTGFRPARAEVDGFEVFEWRAEPARPATGSDTDSSQAA